MAALAVTLFAYLVGCFSTGYYLVRLRTGQDLRTVGSGATGGRNAGRVLGRSGFLLTAAGDILKTVVAIGLPLVLNLGPLALAGAMVGVTAGHIWPFQLGFRGGKGIAPLVGTVAVAAPLALVAAALVAGSLALLTRRQNLGGLTGFAIAPAIAFVLGTPLAVVLAIVLVVAMAAVAHRSNIRDELASIGLVRRAIWGATQGGSGNG